jgi:hypothetical protein
LAFSGQITVIREDTDLGNIDYYGEERVPDSARSHLKMLPIARSAVRHLPITEFAHKARVVRDGRIGAVLAACDVAAEGCRAAALDCRHHLQLFEADMAGIGLTPCRSTAAEDIRNLQGRARHARRVSRAAGSP